MISPILTRLAAVWFFGWGVLLLIGLALGGTLERGAQVAIPMVLLGPPAFMLLLAWVFAPRRSL
jgi:hypothetical protein